MRERVFDPAVADLRIDWAPTLGAGHHAVPRAVARARIAAAIFRAALDCRRLAARDALAARAHLTFRERFLMSWIRDVHHAFRRFRRQPLPAAIAVLTLGLGIGANLAIFGQANTFLLSDIDAPDAGRLVRVFGITDERQVDTVSIPDFRTARDRAAATLDLAAHAQVSAAIGPPETVEARAVELVTGAYFRALQLPATAGRLLDERDDTVEGGHPVAVLSEPFWRTRYGGDGRVIGQTIIINATSFEIVGIGPKRFRGTFNAHSVDLWTPLSMHGIVRPRGLSYERRGWGWASMFGRLKPGATIAAAQGELTQAAADINQRFPNAGIRFGISHAAAVSDDDRERMAPAIGGAFAFTALLFIVTCANLAGVMQSQLLTRRRELAIRQSLGAGRRRLFAEWIAESAALSLLGGAFGLLIAAVTAKVIASIQLPVQLVGDLRFDARMDARVVGYAVLLSALATFFFGLAPAWRAGREPVTPVLKDDGGAVAGGRATVRFRRLAVFVQVAVSVVLLLLAGVIARGLSARLSADPGFPAETLGLMSINPRQMRVPPGDYRAIADRVLQAVRADPAVTAVDLGTNIPLGFGKDRMGFNIPGYTGGRDGSSRVSIDYNVVGRDYFRAVGMAFVAGTTWDALPANPKAPPLVINETMARRMYAGKSVVGLPLEVSGQGVGTIVGVVRDIKYYDLAGPPIPYVYFPAEAQMPGEYTLHIRTAGDPGAALPRLAKVIAGVDHRLAPFDVMTFEDLRRVPLFPARALMVSAMAFGMIALALTAVGLYGVVATSVGQRTREIGVRMALGARPGVVLGGVLRESIAIVAVGAVAGLVLGYFAINALRSVVSDLDGMDAVTAASVAALLVACAVIAAWIPARRAAAIDPVRALRM